MSSAALDGREAGAAPASSDEAVPRRPLPEGAAAGGVPREGPPRGGQLPPVHRALVPRPVPGLLLAQGALPGHAARPGYGQEVPAGVSWESSHLTLRRCYG